MPLTILHVSQPVDGGVARLVVDLLRGQIADGHRVLLACPPQGALAGAATAAGATVLPWAASRTPGRGLPREVAELRGLLARSTPHLVHLHSSKAGLAGRLAVRGGIPTVFQPHAWSFAAVTGPMSWAARHWECWAVRWADRLLCVSEAERAEGTAAGLRACWAVVPNGVDLDHFDPARLPPQEQARELLGLDVADDGPGRGDGRGDRAADPVLGGAGTGGPLAVCVGRLCRQKGQDVLLRAWFGVPARIPGARLALVGDGPDRVALEALAATLPERDTVVFVGQAEDPRQWYAAADLAVLPSRWEGMALVPLEAMACGRPVLLTEVAGARECLEPGEQPLPVDDPSSLHEALVARLSDPAACLGRGARARTRMVARHDIRATLAKVSTIYGEILDERRISGPLSEGSPERMTAGKSD